MKYKRLAAAVLAAALVLAGCGGTKSSSGSAAASASTVGYLAYRSSTTTFTLASVHCAASRTLTSSFHA